MKNLKNALKVYGLPVYTSLDHDLCREAALKYYEMKSKGEKAIDYSAFSKDVYTGLDCLVKLASQHVMKEIELPLLLNIHSHNRYGRQAMIDALKNFFEEEDYILSCEEHPYVIDTNLMPLTTEDIRKYDKGRE